MTEISHASLNPFDLSDATITELAAVELTAEELHLIRAVLKGIQKKVIGPFSMNSGMTHSGNCWAWGPVHYQCAYEHIAAMKRERLALTALELDNISAQTQLPFEDVQAVAKLVEAHHLIGGIS